MATLDQTFVVNVLLQTGGVSRRSFSDLCYIGESQRRETAAKEYADLIAVGVDYFTTDEEYLVAQDVFSQSPKPNKLIIGTRYMKTVLTPSPVANDTVYSFRLNGVLITTTSDGSATDTEIATALVALADAEPGIDATHDTGTVELESTTGVPYAVTEISANLAETQTPMDTWTQAIAAVRVENDSWYALTTEASASADLQEVAGVVVALPNRMYFSNSADPVIVGALDTDAYSIIGAASNTRAVGFYRPSDGTSQRFAAAAAAAFLVHEPGSVTLKFLSVVGHGADTIADTSNLDAKKVNYYTEYSSGSTGTPALQEGKTLGGEFADVIRDTDYISINMRDDLLAAFINNTKVPYNARGLALVEGIVRARMQDAFTREIFDPADTTYLFPTMADTLAADRAARILRGIEINTRAVGAIHFVDGITLKVGA